jgi:hypothetical protein
MSQPPPADQRAAMDADDAFAVVSAYGAFRLLLGLLAAWSFFAGFALIIGAMEYGDDPLTRRVLGAHMLMLAPMYLLLAWRRADYRYFIWVPYAAQIAIVAPGLWELVVNQDFEGPLVLVVSAIFLALLIYLWTSSRPLAAFRSSDVEEDEDIDEFDDEEEDAPSLNDPTSRGRRYRRSD